MPQAFFLEKPKENIGVLYFDLQDERVNKFNTPVMQELDDITKKLRDDSDIKCLLLMSRKKDIFIAGADVNEILTIKDEQQGYEVSRQGQEIFKAFGSLPYPTVAVIDGACMGGGTEISLACDYRLATDSPKTEIAFPEVNLGILPGWGGISRLPKLIGLQKSLDIILTGRKIDAKRALRYGLVDQVIAAEWAPDQALAFAEGIISGKAKKQIKRRRSAGLSGLFLEKTPVGRNIMFSQAEKMILKKTGGHYPAPLLALETIKNTHKKPLEEAFEIEAKNLARLIVSDISRHLVQIYLWTDEIKKENGTENKDATVKEIQKAGLLGAGVMGGGIAQLFAGKGITVRVKDINHEAVTKAYQQASEVLKGKLKRRRITSLELKQIINRISGGVDYHGFKNADLVIEAIVEDLQIKKSVLKELEGYIDGQAIVATNTSSLRVDDMAEALSKKDRFVGMHFFNPVHRMPLVEIVKGKHSSDEALATAFKLALALNKVPIAVNDGPGFLVNRLLLPYMVEAIALLTEGNDMRIIDRTMKNFGMAMGPIELFDEVGIDVAAKVAKILRQTMGDRMADSDILQKMIDDGRLGKKTNRGFYLYTGKKREFDPRIKSLIKSVQKAESKEADMIRRMVYPMVNEAARCLEEKIALRPRDVDVGMIFGTGFAPFRGGLLKYADQVGLDKIIDHLTHLSEKYGERFKPSKALLDVHESRRQFYTG